MVLDLIVVLLISSYGGVATVNGPTPGKLIVPYNTTAKYQCSGDRFQKKIQWNPFTPDTIRTIVSVLISGVSLFQGLILYTFVCICGKTKCLDLRGVQI